MHAEKCPVCAGYGKIAITAPDRAATHDCHGCHARGWIIVGDAIDPLIQEEFCKRRATLLMASSTGDVGVAARVVMSPALVKRFLTDGQMNCRKDETTGDTIVTGLAIGNHWLTAESEHG